MIVLIVYDKKEGWRWSVTDDQKRTYMGTAEDLAKCFEIVDGHGILPLKVTCEAQQLQIKGEDYGRLL